MPAEKLFLDSAYPIALASAADQHHNTTARLAQVLKAKPEPMVTTPAVLLEVGNALAKLQFRQFSIQILDAFEKDPLLEIVSLDDALYKSGFALFASRADKLWSLTDCISLVVMSERGLTQALTSDQHFEQAGFVPLLRK